MTLDGIGYGAGSRESDAVPNLLRVLIGRACPSGTASGADCQVDSVVELAANNRAPQHLVHYLRDAHISLGEGDGVFMHDVLAAAVWLDLIDVEWRTVAVSEVVLEGKRRGMIVSDAAHGHPVKYARRVDEEGFLGLWSQLAGSVLA